jgi:hypothetical protein
MLRRTARRSFAPYVPSPRLDTRKTQPPPPAVEVGGLEGDGHNAYSDRLARTPRWKLMGETSYEQRMRENATRYPFSQSPGLPRQTYDVRFLPVAIKDPETHKPLLRLGQNFKTPLNLPVPVIFLRDTKTKRGFIGRRFQTKYVNPFFMRNHLHPGKFAVYATPEWYERLGLPARDHRIHEEVPQDRSMLERLRQKQLWVEEPWRYTTFVRFHKYRGGPPELRDDPTPWNGQEETAPAGGAVGGRAGAGDVAGRGPRVIRKARKVKLF